MTEREKMLAGELYRADDPELLAGRARARAALRDWAADGDVHRLRALFGALGEGAAVMPGFACDYGSNIHAGRNLFVNFNCVFLDPAPITIGDDVQVGPAVQVYTATHPTDAAVRRSGLELARPVRIGDGAWIGGGAIILPGVTVGEGAVIGAGAVVTRDVPAGTVMIGGPARELRGTR